MVFDGKMVVPGSTMLTTGGPCAPGTTTGNVVVVVGIAVVTPPAGSPIGGVVVVVNHMGSKGTTLPVNLRGNAPDTN